MTQFQPPEAIGLSPERLDHVYRFLEEAVQTDKIPGAAIQITRQGVSLAPRSFGRLNLTADSPPVQPDTIFLTASVTKPVTVTATMLLVEREKLRLDDPVSLIIPEFGVNGKEKVTVRHLMTHTSGLPDMLPEDRTLRAQHAPLGEFARRICARPLDFPAGTNIQYQSCGIAILGALIKQIEGVSLPTFLQREIFAPLSMADTALGRQNLPTERIAQVNIPAEMQGKSWGWNMPYWHNFGAPWGGMFSTVGDMSRFCQMFLNGGELDGVRILSPATVQAMTADQTSMMPTIPSAVRAEQSWGLGWRRQPTSEASFFGNLLTTVAYGHGGATGTVVWVDPTHKLICILFTTQPPVIGEGLLGHCSNLVAAAAI